MNRETSTPLPLLVTAALAGAIVLAFADAPQSLGMVFRAGLDTPELIGEQLAITLFGALATAAAVLLTRWWRWLLPAAALGVFVAHLGYNPDVRGLYVRVAGAGRVAPPEFVSELPWVCLDIASAGVLLVAVLAAAQRLYREHPAGASVTAVIGCAGYLGVSLVGPLRSVDTGTARLVVVGIATVLTAATLLSREKAEQPSGPSRAAIAAAVAALATAFPALMVAITGERIFGTALGGIAGLALTALAVGAAIQLGPNGLIATGAVALAMVAPVGIVFIFADALVVDVRGLLGLIGVAVAAAAVFGQRRLVAAAGVLGVTAVLLILLASGALTFAEGAAGFIIWTLIIACIASAGAAAGAVAPFLANRGVLPAAGAVVTALAVGVNGSLNFLRIGEPGRPNLAMIFEWPGFLLAAGLMVVAAVLLLLLRSLDQVRTTGPLDDYRRVFTTTAATPPENQ